MSDRPWLEETAAALRPEREVLKQLGALAPPPGSVDRGWAALSAALPAAAPVAAAAAGMSALGKLALGVALAGGALWAGSELWSPASPAPVPAPVAAQAPRAHEAAEVTPAPSPSEAPVASDEPKLRGARPSTPNSTLAEEGRLLASAHRLVQQGKGGEALEVLRSLAARYPRSVLWQEREVLTIEALGATGDTKAARARAERFLRRQPSSPHAGRLQRFVQ